jgi:hypothetical protein
MSSEIIYTGLNCIKFPQDNASPYVTDFCGVFSYQNPEAKFQGEVFLGGNESGSFISSINGDL